MKRPYIYSFRPSCRGGGCILGTACNAVQHCCTIRMLWDVEKSVQARRKQLLSGGGILGYAPYRVIVVDDDRVIREDMIASVDWQAHGFQVVAQAANGREAMQYILGNGVDVVITDICMPLMDGVQLIDCVSRKLPDTMFLILSNYDDFKYVRTALKLGAFDYLLKYEITPPLLSAMLDRMQEALAGFGRDCADRGQACAANRMADYTLRELRLLHAGKSGIQSVHAEGLGELCGVPWLFCFPHVDDSLLKQWEEHLTRTLVGLCGVEGICFRRCESDCLLLCVAFLPGCDLQQASAAATRQIRRALEAVKEDGVMAVCGSPAGDISVYKQGLSELVNRLNLLPQNNGAVSLPGAMPCAYKNYFDMERYKRKIDRIVYLLGINNTPKMLAALGELVQMIREEHLSRPATVHVYHLLVMALNVYGAANTAGGHFLPIHSLDGIMNVDSACERVTTLIYELQRQAPQTTVAIRRPEIARAVKYMHANLNRNLDLAEVAEEVNLSRNYFCKLFRQVMDKSFVDYLHMLRMERACVLIGASELSLADISEMVGFNSYNYFHDIFKKLYGISPGEYRERMKGEPA